MPIYRDTARARWRYEFSRIVDGRRCRTAKLLPPAWTRQQAEAYAHQRDAHLYAIATGAVRPQALISQAVKLYLTERAPALKNRAKLERDLALLMPAYAGRTIDQLPAVCREYAAAQALRLQPATVKLRLSYLRSACRWAWKHHALTDHDPAERVTLPPVRNARQRYIGRADVLRIARRIGPHQARGAVLVAFYSGMRLGEVMSAQPGAHGWLLADTKNGSARLVPVHPRVAHWARRWPPPVAARTVEHHFVTAARALGLHDLRFHDLRHSAASSMINAGVPLYTVGQVLGHKAAASTQRYSHLDTSTTSDAVRRIGRR
ncbi:MAG: site-specific integrase [Rubrivivax sp.]|nr:site-specific integrase [Rubrivivax sp.]